MSRGPQTGRQGAVSESVASQTRRMKEAMLGLNDGDYFGLRVFGRSYPRAADYWDGNWVDAEVTIRIRPYWSSRATDWVTFASQARRDRKGSDESLVRHDW